MIRAPGCTCEASPCTERPCSEIIATSCNAQPSLAAARENADGDGITRISVASSWRISVAPTPKNIGSPVARIVTGVPRRAITRAMVSLMPKVQAMVSR